MASSTLEKLDSWTDGNHAKEELPETTVGHLTPAQEHPDPMENIQTAQTDGGLWAWLRVFAAWLLFLVTWGPALSFGTFQDYYSTTILRSHSASDISWIGGTSTTLLILGGAIAGPLFDRGYLKPLMVLGCFLQILGFMMLSLASKYYQVYLSQGLCYGLGCGLVYVPGLAFVTISFTKRRAIAVGITTTGSSLGGIIFPSIFRGLINRIGFAWTCRTIAFVQLGCSLAAAALLYNAPVKKSKPRRLIDWTAFKGLAFDAFFVVNFCQFLSYWVILFYIPTFAITKVGLSDDDAIYLTVVILNAASVFGRIFPQLAVQKYGAAQIVAIANFVAMVLMFSWMAVSSQAGLVVWCIAFGFTTGCFVSANPIMVTHRLMSPSLETMGTRLGMLWFAGGIGALVGGPIAGALVDPKTGDFVPAQAFSGGLMALGFLCMLVIVILILRLNKQEKEDKASLSSS